MDNKALAEFIRTELSKVISAVNKLAIKIASLHAPREQNDASPTPHHATTHENNTASRESTLLTQVPPAPSNSPQTQERWYKTLDGWKAALEIVAIPFAIGYAIVTGLQWYDLRHNFQVDERAWIKVETLYPPQPTADFGVIINASNVGKSVVTKSLTEVDIQLLKNSASPTMVFPEHHTRAIQAIMFPNTNREITRRGLWNADGSLRQLQQGEVMDLIKGAAYIVTFGQITYTDQFGAHWTRFCTWQTYVSVPFTQSMAFAARPCADWNSVGDGSPPI